MTALKKRIDTLESKTRPAAEQITKIVRLIIRPADGAVVGRMVKNRSKSDPAKWTEYKDEGIDHA